jgi:hypothetical protein
MRLAKLSSDEFSDAAELSKFFAGIKDQNPPGLFRIGKQISKDGLYPGETVLFSLSGKVLFVGKTLSGRMDNKYGYENEYPYCFLVDHNSLRPTNISFAELERLLSSEGIPLSLAGQGWNKLPDDLRIEKFIHELAGVSWAA